MRQNHELFMYFICSGFIKITLLHHERRGVFGMQNKMRRIADLRQTREEIKTKRHNINMPTRQSPNDVKTKQDNNPARSRRTHRHEDQTALWVQRCVLFSSFIQEMFSG